MNQNQNTNRTEQPKEFVVPSETQKDSEPISPATPTTIIQAATINDKQEITEMEVHKHPHHVMHKKKWNEYLLEFFMLFLAVFLGFIAENIREHYAEKKHEKEFALQLSEGLKQDTASLNFILLANERENSDYDSLLFYESMPDQEEKWEGISRHIEHINGSPLFVSHQVSFEQIQNIGALRYFKNQDIVKKFAEYKYWVGLINYQQSIYTQYCSNNLEPFLLSHFNENQFPQRFGTHVKTPDAASSFIPAFASNADDARFFQNLVIQGREKLLLPQYNLKAMRDRAIELIELLEKEYHFKGE